MSEEQQESLSKEEILRRKQELTDFYKENIEHLKVQLEYETLLKDISKVRAERLQADAFVSQVMNSVNDDDEEEPQQRSLKRK